MKFSKGQIVEIIGAKHLPEFLGEQFPITSRTSARNLTFINDATRIGTYYASGLSKDGHELWVSERNLKLVKDNGNQPSELSFSQLMRFITKIEAGNHVSRVPRTNKYR